MAAAKLLLQQPYKTGTKILNPLETRLYCFLIIDRKNVVKIKTEHKIYPEQWDFKNQQKKLIKGSPELSERIGNFNKDLRKLKDDIETKYRELIKQFPDMPFSQLAMTLKEYGKTKEIPFLKNDKDFLGRLDDYMTALKGEVSDNTIKKFVSVKNSLTEFIKANPKYEHLTFSMIDHSFKDAYVYFLHNQPARGRMKTRPEGMQDGVLLNTEAKYIECLKGFCKWAEERNFNQYTTYKEFKSITQANRKRKKQKNDIITLTLPELRQFYSHEFKKNEKHLERVRDLWCIGAFTTARWSDIERFDKSQVEDNVWTFESFKTKKKTTIDLVGYFATALDIFRKYDYELPIITLAKVNSYLKQAAEVAGITSQSQKTRYVGPNEIPIIKAKCKFLSMHDARRTAISILLNDYNFPISHLMEITGHVDIKTLQVYVNKDRDSRRKAANKTKRIDEPLTIAV